MGERNLRAAVIVAVSPTIGLLVRATNPVSLGQRERMTELNAGKAADAVMELVPTREQIADAVTAAWVSPDVGCEQIVDAVMALLNGPAYGVTKAGL